MDSGTVETFCDAAVQLLPALVDYASVDADKRKSEDDAMIRQLRVAAGAIVDALMERPRRQPMMPLPTPPNVGASS